MKRVVLLRADRRSSELPITGGYEVAHEVNSEVKNVKKLLDSFLFYICRDVKLSQGLTDNPCALLLDGNLSARGP